MPPTTPIGIPQVTGIYDGPLTVNVTEIPDDLLATDCRVVDGRCRLAGDLEIRAEQDGETVTLRGTVTMEGDQPSPLWEDGLTGTIDHRGVLDCPMPKDYTDDVCGRVRFQSQRIVFGWGILSYRRVARTDHCGQFDFEAELDRL